MVEPLPSLKMTLKRISIEPIGRHRESHFRFSVHPQVLIGDGKIRLEGLRRAIGNGSHTIPSGLWVTQHSQAMDEDDKRADPSHKSEASAELILEKSSRTPYLRSRSGTSHPSPYSRFSGTSCHHAVRGVR